MAYSIGSSLVKTSRKPWTMRFWRLVLGQTSAHQVEHLLGADLPDGGLVGHRRVVFLDVDVRVRVASADVVEHQCVAADARDDVGGARRDLELTAVGRPAAVLRHGLADDPRAGVGSQVDGLGARVLVLALAGDRHADDVGRGALAAQVDRRELDRLARAGVGVDPFDRRVLVRVGPLGHEVVDVVRPVLDRGVADLRTRQRNDLDDGHVERIGGVDGRRAVMDREPAGEVGVRSRAPSRGCRPSRRTAAISIFRIGTQKQFRPASNQTRLTVSRPRRSGRRTASLWWMRTPVAPSSRRTPCGH